MATDRLQKILARAGIASRRAAEEYIAAGRVRVNGRVVRELGTKADPRQDRVEVDGQRIIAEAPAYVVLHKPRGVVSTMSDPEGRPTIREILANVPVRVFPIGRLDFATSGVLLATNDGGFAEGLMHPRKAVPKTYVLKVKGLMKPDDLDRWRQGMRLEDGMTLPAEAKLLRHEEDKTWIELTIREGRNQQIRRMGEASGFRVMRLARTEFAEISSEGLRPGEWRFMTRDELLAMKNAYGVPERVLHGAPEVPRSNRRPHAPARAGGRSPSAVRASLRARSVPLSELPSSARRTSRGKKRAEPGSRPEEPSSVSSRGRSGQARGDDRASRRGPPSRTRGRGTR